MDVVAWHAKAEHRESDVEVALHVGCSRNAAADSAAEQHNLGIVYMGQAALTLRRNFILPADCPKGNAVKGDRPVV